MLNKSSVAVQVFVVSWKDVNKWLTRSSKKNQLSASPWYDMDHMENDDFNNSLLPQKLVYWAIA
jgi:hypothetical protein